MSAHTPGPWSWGPDYQGLYGSGKDNDVLTHYSFEGMHLSYGARQEANARLIAAAPDLLAALRRAVMALAFASETSPAMRDDYEAVSAAIQKATEVAP